MCAHLASPSAASLLGFVRASDLELLVSVTKQLVHQQHRLECPEVNRPGSPPEDQATETLVDLSSPSGDRHHVVREFLSTPPEHVAAELTARHWSLFSSIAISELFESGSNQVPPQAPSPGGHMTDEHVLGLSIRRFFELEWKGADSCPYDC
jgi:hypothetical protein